MHHVPMRRFAERSGGTLAGTGTQDVPALVPGGLQRMTDSRFLVIVDDDAASREHVVRAMRDWGCDASGGLDHASALDAPRGDRPELTLVDLRRSKHAVTR